MTLDVWLVALALLGVRLPVPLGQRDAWPLRWLLLSPYLLSIGLKLSHLHKRFLARPDGGLVMLIVGYLGVLSLSFMRTIVVGKQAVAVSAASWMVVVVLGTFSLLACLFAPSDEEQDRLGRAILLRCVACMAGNVILYFGGFQQAEVQYGKPFPISMLELRASSVVVPMVGGIIPLEPSVEPLWRCPGQSSSGDWTPGGSASSRWQDWCWG